MLKVNVTVEQRQRCVRSDPSAAPAPIILKAMWVREGETNGDGDAAVSECQDLLNARRSFNTSNSPLNDRQVWKMVVDDVIKCLAVQRPFSSNFTLSGKRTVENP